MKKKPKIKRTTAKISKGGSNLSKKHSMKTAGKTKTAKKPKATVKKRASIKSLKAPKKEIPLVKAAVPKPSGAPLKTHPVKEGVFEVVIPKYKVKQKFHPHARPRPQAPKPKEFQEAPPQEQRPLPREKKQVEIGFPVTLKDLSVKIQIKPADIISNLIKKGIFATINQILDEETAKTAAADFGFDLVKAATLEEQVLERHQELDKENLMPRPPVVTFMGHVDHGKTSLLDVIRKSNITEREAGGITQHIGAYRIEMPKGAITFLDTPGHEAFTAMRARGVVATDIVVLVVAADDGVMPQTVEALDHAKAAGVPVVVALNKIDKPAADVERVKKQFNQLGLRSEEWGGKTIMVGVSAKTKEGIDKLLEMVLLEAEMLELKANATKFANGVVIEGRLSRGRGPVATVLVKNGVLKEGDSIVIGANYGKIRAMINDKGRKLEKVLPSVPVEISGLSGIPQAGERFYVVEDEKKAKEIFREKQILSRQGKAAAVTKKITLEDIYSQIKEGKIKELKLILKADVQGSLEALKNALEKMSTKEVKVDIIHCDVGFINEADTILAAASNAIIIGFNVSASPEGYENIKKEEIDVRFYRIIYDVTSDIKSAMEGLLEPRIDEVFEGRAIVKRVFSVSKVGLIAGCIVQKGAIGRTDSCKLIRNAKEIYESKISSLKRFKDDVKEVKEGFECGIGVANFDKIEPGDIIEAFTIRKTARKL